MLKRSWVSVSCGIGFPFLLSLPIFRVCWDSIMFTHWSWNPTPIVWVVPIKAALAFLALVETRLCGQVSKLKQKNEIHCRSREKTCPERRETGGQGGMRTTYLLPTFFPMVPGSWAAFKFVQEQSGTRYNPPARPVQLQRPSGRNILPPQPPPPRTPPHLNTKQHQCRTHSPFHAPPHPRLSSGLRRRPEEKQTWAVLQNNGRKTQTRRHFGSNKRAGGRR